MGHGHSHGAGTSNEKRLLLAAVIIGGFMIAEIVGGLVSGSLALLADAGHMVTDFVSLVLAYLAMRFARLPADQSRSYGYGRLQVLAAFVNGIALFPIGLWIIVEAWHRIETPQPVTGGLLLVIAALGFLVNIAAFWLLHGSEEKNINMRAAAAHVIGDLLGSVAAIVAGLVILWTGWTPIDPILSLVVAAIILISGWRVTRDAGRVLLEAAPAELDVAQIAPALVGEIEAVRDIHHLHVWMLTDERSIATLHAVLHETADQDAAVADIKSLLHERFAIDHVTVEREIGTCADDVAKKPEDHHHHGHRDGMAHVH